MNEPPSTLEIFPIYYASKAIIIVLGIGMIAYSWWKSNKSKKDKNR